MFQQQSHTNSWFTLK